MRNFFTFFSPFIFLSESLFINQTGSFFTSLARFTLRLVPQPTRWLTKLSMLSKIVMICFLFLTVSLFGKSFDSYLAKLKEIREQERSGELSKKQTVGMDIVVNNLFRSQYKQLAEEISSDTGLPAHKRDYLIAFARYESTRLISLLDLEKVMTKKACQEAESLYEFYEESFEKMAKKNEKNIPSDYHRLYGNISMMYANVCLSGFGQVRKLISSTKQFDKALEKDKNNFEAHIASGVWRYYAPKIGGGSTEKAINHFQTATKDASPVNRYMAYGWLSQAIFKDSKKKRLADAKAEIKNGKEIFPNGRFLNYLDSLLDKNLYIGE